MDLCLVGSEMCIRDRPCSRPRRRVTRAELDSFRLSTTGRSHLASVFRHEGDRSHTRVLRFPCTGFTILQLAQDICTICGEVFSIGMLKLCNAHVYICVCVCVCVRPLCVHVLYVRICVCVPAHMHVYVYMCSYIYAACQHTLTYARTRGRLAAQDVRVI